MDYLEKIVIEIELHSVEGIRECFRNGINPNDHFKNAPLIYELTSEYTRSPRFKDCVRAFVDYGLLLEDKALLAVLLDDGHSLRKILKDNHEVIDKRYTFRCAYTPLDQATLL